MNASLTIHTESGALVLADSASAPRSESLMDPERKELRRLADRGQIFYLDSEDPSDYRLGLFIDEEPALPSHRYERNGGSFLLSLPSGRLLLTGGHEFEVEPGSYSVTVLEQAVVDAQAIEKERQSILTPEQWRLRRRAEKLAVVGCVPFLAAWVVVFIYQFSVVSLVAIVVALAAAAPSYLLGKTKRYQETEALLRQHDLSYPSHAIVIRPIAETSGLVGGYLVVS